MRKHTIGNTQISHTLNNAQTLTHKNVIYATSLNIRPNRKRNKLLPFQNKLNQFITI